MRFNVGRFNIGRFNVPEGASLPSARASVRFAHALLPSVHRFAAVNGIIVLEGQFTASAGWGASAQAVVRFDAHAMPTGIVWQWGTGRIAVPTSAQPTRHHLPSSLAALRMHTAASPTARVFAVNGGWIAIDGISHATRRTFGASPHNHIRLPGASLPTRHLYPPLDPARIEIIATRPTLHAFETATIDLAGLALQPGDVLVIDCDRMTVTLGGHNAMRYLSDDSDFFRLLRGENALWLDGAIEASPTTMKVEWRDLYL